MFGPKIQLKVQKFAKLSSNLRCSAVICAAAQGGKIFQTVMQNFGAAAQEFALQRRALWQTARHCSRWRSTVAELQFLYFKAYFGAKLVRKAAEGPPKWFPCMECARIL